MQQFLDYGVHDRQKYSSSAAPDPSPVEPAAPHGMRRIAGPYPCRCRAWPRTRATTNMAPRSAGLPRSSSTPAGDARRRMPRLRQQQALRLVSPDSCAGLRSSRLLAPASQRHVEHRLRARRRARARRRRLRRRPAQTTHLDRASPIDAKDNNRGSCQRSRAQGRERLSHDHKLRIAPLRSGESMYLYPCEGRCPRWLPVHHGTAHPHRNMPTNERASRVSPAGTNVSSAESRRPDRRLSSIPFRRSIACA